MIIEFLWELKARFNVLWLLGQEATIENPDRVNAVDTYVFSNFYSNFWLIFGKLQEARSRLYRSRFLLRNTHPLQIHKANSKIYQNLREWMNIPQDCIIH